MKVTWTATARQHLKAIRNYVAADSPTYALRLIDRITRRSTQLREFPESGGRVIEYDDDRIRELIEGNYRIIYRVQENRVEVLAVVHAARQLPHQAPPADD